MKKLATNISADTIPFTLNFDSLKIHKRIKIVVIKIMVIDMWYYMENEMFTILADKEKQ